MDRIERNTLTEEQKSRFQLEADFLSLEINTINEVDNIVNNNTTVNKVQQEKDIEVELVKDRHGDLIELNDYLIYIENRDYYVDEDDSFYLESFQCYEDIHRVIQALDEDGQEISCSDDYENLVYIDADDSFYLNDTAAINAGYIYDSEKNIWIRKPIENKNVTELNFYKDLKESIDGFFPNNWWLQSTAYTFDLNNDLRKYVFNDYGYKQAPYCLIIKFPELTISNSDRQNHTIKDLYIAILLKENGSFYRACFYGFRGTMTNLERHNNYYHSHLPNSTEWYIGQFCLGSGPLVEIVTKLRNTFDIKIFNLFLANLAIYVEWESIEGTPHRRLNKVIQKSSAVTPYFSTDGLEEDLEKLIKNKKLNFNISFNSNLKLIELDFNSLELNLSELLGYSANCYCYKDTDNNEYFDLKIVTGNNTPNFKEPLCTLDEEKIFMKIEQVDNITTTYKKIIHPNISNHAKKYLSWRINDYFYKEN